MQTGSAGPAGTVAMASADLRWPAENNHARQEIEVRSRHLQNFAFFHLVLCVIILSCGVRAAGLNPRYCSSRNRGYSVMSGAVFLGQACVTHLTDLFNPVYRIV